MPELPEVEIVKNGLLPKVVGRTITHVNVSEKVRTGHDELKKTIVKGDLETFINALKGATVLHLSRRGKYLNFQLKKDETYFHLVSHLGMSGAYFVVKTLDDILEANYKNHAHVLFTLDSGEMLVYSDIRRFGEMRILDSIKDYPPFKEMATEYTDALSLRQFIERIRLEKYENSAIKSVIMDSKVIPGVGNIYASESLFRCGILPTRKVGRISERRLKELHYEITQVLDEAIARGGSTISDYRSADGEKGTMQDKFYVYQKKSCPRCGQQLSTKVISKRNTFYCTKCQR